MTENPSLRGGLSLPSAEKRTLEGTEYSESELAYISECEDTFLGDTIVADGLISQKEFAETYSNFCLTYGDQDWCPGSNFGNLPETLQSVFYEAVCMNMLEPDECVTNLNTLPMAVGYIVSPEVMADVQRHVQGICRGMMDQVFYPIDPSSVLPSDFPHSSAVDSGAYELPEPTLIDQVEGQVSESLATPVPDPKVESDQVLDLTDSSGANKLLAGSDPSFSHAPIIGIAAVASACLLLVAFVMYRRRKSSLYDKNLKEIGSENGRASRKDIEAADQQSRDLVLKNNSLASNFDIRDANMSLKMPSEKSSLSSRSGFGRGLAFSSNNATSDQIEEAVDFGNWDSVYKLASQLAEQDDLITLSSAGRKPTHLRTQRLERRMILGEEDRERARTLDELIANGDWTGVAVTAALYAGESGYPKRSHFSGRGAGASSSATAITTISWQPPPVLGACGVDTASETSHGDSTAEGEASVHPLLQLKRCMDQAVDNGDWEKVLLISTQIEEHEAYRMRLEGQTESAIVSVPRTVDSNGSKDAAPYQTLLEEMDRAMTRGDWALVGLYADRIRDVKVGHVAGDPKISTSRALVPLSRPRSAYVDCTPNSTQSKKTTLEKLVNAEKWKGVSIMAGLYEMEAKGSFSTGSIS